jgi:hypothetical protein
VASATLSFVDTGDSTPPDVLFAAVAAPATGIRRLLHLSGKRKELEREGMDWRGE